jgi:NADH-quinone oxidoreductase subunit L
MYDFLFVIPYLRLVHALRDDPVAQAFTVLEHAAIAAHRQLRATQNGRLRRYAGWLAAGSVATVALVLFG